MPSRVPIRNGKFSNAPDFNNQGVTGITGYGVFRSFNYLSTGSSSRTLQNSDLWTTLVVTGNCVITIPDNLGASVGDEIIIVNPAGFTSFTASGSITFLSTANIVPAERPARLIYLGTVAGYGTPVWLLSGLKTSLTSTTPTDCCTNTLSPFYTLGAFSVYSVVYANANATSLYTSSNIGNVVLVGSTGYTITSGVATETPCALVNFQYVYTFYNSTGNTINLYTYLNVDIYNPAQIIGLPFRETNTSGIFPCDTSPINGTYYRGYDMYTLLSPVCFSNGVIIVDEYCS
jgi:hypothetical protein